MYIVLGSTSPVKVNATKQAFDTYFDDVEVKGLPLASGVKAFPTSDKETLQGALNRANEARSLEPEADFSVGIEGGLSKFDRYVLVKQVAVVIKEDVTGIGVSAGYSAPERLLRQLDMASDESRNIIDSYFGRKEILSNEGAIGVVTNGVLDRTRVTKDAVICALTRFVNTQFY
jgi:inosine/xanthosine triphosphatase